MPVCHTYVLKTPYGTVDVRLIRDEANELCQNKGPHIEVYPLGENLETMVEKAQGDNPAASHPTDTIPGGSTTLRSSLYIP